MKPWTQPVSPCGLRAREWLLRQQAREAGEHFEVVTRLLRQCAEDIARLDHAQTALDGQCGRHRLGPSPRELAAELALAALAPLAPHVPFVSAEAAVAAAARLTSVEETA